MKVDVAWWLDNHKRIALVSSDNKVMGLYREGSEEYAKLSSVLDLLEPVSGSSGVWKHYNLTSEEVCSVLGCHKL
ncbi:hypothetical protein D3C86_1569270 [compost metagenome]